MPLEKHEQGIDRLSASLVLTVVYFLAAKGGLTLAFVQANATPVWAPTGIAIASLIIWGWEIWPGVFMGAFWVNLVTNGTVLSSLCIATGNSLEALTGYYLVTRFARGRDALHYVSESLKYSILAGLVAPMVSATIGVGSLSLLGFAQNGSFKEIWLTWWLGDVGGALLVGPVLLLWPRQLPRKVPAARYLEAGALAGLLLLACSYALGGWSTHSLRNYPVQFIFVPVLLWATSRFGNFGAALASLAVSAFAIEGTLRGWGPFHGTTENESLLLLQGFMGVTSVTMLVLGAGLEERRRAIQELNLSHSELQEKVLERTQMLKQKSEEMENSEKYFRALIENALDIVTILDEKGTILFESPSINRFLGYSTTELNGVNAFSLVHTEDLPQVQAAFMGVLEDPGSIRSVKFRFKHKDGSWRVLESIGSNLLHDEAIRGIVVNSRDMTEEVRAQEGLTEREERLRLLVENIKDYALFLLDPQGRVMTWNSGAERIKGYRAEEVIGKPSSIFYASADIKKGLPEKLLTEAAEKGRVEEESWLVRKDGTRFWSNTILTALRNENGSIRGFVKITRDITQRKKMEELARSNRELEQFAYVASHDLQEPLRMITSFVQLLAQQYKGKLDKDADSYIHEIVDGASRMRALILDLLAYSRVDSASEPFTEVDSAKALDRALSDLEVTLRENKAEVCQGALPVVRGDFNQIVQLFQNLIGNAVKFHGPDPPRIQVEATQKGEEWVFSVQDNGIGLEPQYAEQIFEVFKRLHNRSDYPGTGIGLAICKKVVTRHGGQIWVESQPGKGATFYWTMPVLKEAALGLVR